MSIGYFEFLAIVPRVGLVGQSLAARGGGGGVVCGGFLWMVSVGGECLWGVVER